MIHARSSSFKISEVYHTNLTNISQKTATIILSPCGPPMKLIQIRILQISLKPNPIRPCFLRPCAAALSPVTSVITIKFTIKLFPLVLNIWMLFFCPSLFLPVSRPYSLRSRRTHVWVRVAPSLCVVEPLRREKRRPARCRTPGHS